MIKPHVSLRRGDLCHHGASSYPIYAVICVHGGRAWVRDISSGVEAIVDSTGCHRLGPEEARDLKVDLRRLADLTPRRVNLTPDLAADCPDCPEGAAADRARAAIASGRTMKRPNGSRAPWRTFHLLTGKAPPRPEVGPGSHPPRS